MEKNDKVETRDQTIPESDEEAQEAYFTYQNAKSKYQSLLKSRGATHNNRLHLGTQTQMMSQPVSVWKMQRAEFLEALIDLKVKYEPSMSVPELRSLLMEARGPQGKIGPGADQMHGRSTEGKAFGGGIGDTPKGNAGLLMRMLRYSMETTGESGVTFGLEPLWASRAVHFRFLEVVDVCCVHVSTFVMQNLRDLAFSWKPKSCKKIFFNWYIT